MNVIPGVITQVRVHQNLSLVSIQAQNIRLSAIVIDTPETCDYLQQGTSINAIFKETEVILGQGHHHAISLQNQLKGHIQAVESAKLLSKITVSTEVGPIVSIITTHAVEQLNLQINSVVTAMIKTNEIMLSK